MKITLFSATGLQDFDACLEMNEINRIGESELRSLLKTINLSFIYEDINRLQSTLICECKDSYVQQSQRYVSLTEDAYDLPELSKEDETQANSLLKEAFSLYAEMSEKKAGEFKGRPKIEHYLHGIPIEDARYILPLMAKTNVCTAMAGDKLIDLFRLFNDVQYGALFHEIAESLQEFVPKRLFMLICQQNNREIHSELVESFYAEMFAKLSPTDNLVFFDQCGELDKKVGFGALTSTMKDAPSAVIARWGEEADTKARGVVERVLGYGHDSIAEQARVRFAMMCSLVTYHQQERHRITSNYREDFVKVILDENREVKIPQTINNSKFKERFIELTRKFKDFRLDIAKRYGMDKAMCFLLNCDQIKLMISTNARADISMLADRTCMNAQWEIRELAIKKVIALRTLSPVLYEKALPSCVKGICREGRMSCGQAGKVRELFAKL